MNIILHILVDNVAVLFGIHVEGLSRKTQIYNPSFYEAVHTKRMFDWIEKITKDGKCPKIP